MLSSKQSLSQSQPPHAWHSNQAWPWQEVLGIILLPQMGKHHKASKERASGEDALLETRQPLVACFWCWVAPTEPPTWAASDRSSRDFGSLLGLPGLIPLLHADGLAHEHGIGRKRKFKLNGMMAELSCPALLSNHLSLIRHTYSTIKQKVIPMSDNGLQFSAVMLHGSTRT